VLVAVVTFVVATVVCSIGVTGVPSVIVIGVVSIVTGCVMGVCPVSVTGAVVKGVVVPVVIVESRLHPAKIGNIKSKTIMKLIRFFNTTLSTSSLEFFTVNQIEIIPVRLVI
jgi:hypothetical protein